MASLKDFEILNKLGEGSFGQVYKVRRRVDRVTYVMKQINISKMNQRMKNEALNEVAILSKLDNQYIVKYFDSFIDKQVLCIIMEFCEQGDLHCFLKGQLGRPLTENQVWRFMIQMCLGLTYLHRSKILHRDIKSMNIFLCREAQVRIGDLGVAKVLSDQNNFARTMVGTPYYLSPEMCEEKPYNEKSDIWALGCVLYELCTFKHPFEATNQGALVLKIIRGRYEPVSTKLYSQGLISIVDSCLQKDLKTRPTAYELLQKQALIQSAKSLDIVLNLNTPHPSSNKSKEQASEPKQPVTTAATKPDLQKQPLAVKGVAQALQVAPKPNLDRVSVPLNQMVGVKVEPKERYPQETPQPSKKEVGVNQSPAQRVVIKSSAFNQKQQQAPIQQEKVVQGNAPLSQKEYQNMYKDWKQKVDELQQQPTPGKQVEIVKVQKQALPPTKKPVTARVSSAQNTPQQQKVKSEPKTAEQQEKKRIRKGAPQELARKAQQIPLIGKQAQKEQDEDIEARDARDKLRLLKNKKQKQQSLTDEQKEVLNLPDKIITKRERSPIPNNQKVVEDIDDFFNDQIKMIREQQQLQQQQNNSETIKPQYQNMGGNMFQVNSSPNDDVTETTDVADSQANEIPFVEVEEDVFEEQEQPEEDLILFEEDEERQEEPVDSDQEVLSRLLRFEAYYEEEEQGMNDTYDYGQQEEETLLETFNQFPTIREDPREFEETKHYHEEQDEEEEEEEELVIDGHRLELNKKILENEKRRVELQMLMQAKVRECVRELGQNKTTELIDFLRKKLNVKKIGKMFQSDIELTDDDQEEINVMVQSKYIGQKSPTILYTFYKILHYEIELDKCTSNIEDLHRQLDEC